MKITTSLFASKKVSLERSDVDQVGMFGAINRSQYAPQSSSTGEFNQQKDCLLFREFERIYYELKYEELEFIRRVTGCGKPCNYLEYKFHGDAIPSSFKLSESSNYFVFSLLAHTRFTSVAKEELLYPSSTMVAEVGGTLGLFLGFSFMTIWDGAIWMRDYFGFCKST